VHAVLYNTGQSVESILFDEKQIITTELMKIKKTEVPLKVKGDIYGHIFHVPVAMLAASNPEKLH